MKAFNIKWMIDLDEVYEKLDDMTAKKASEELGISYDTYANMTTEERHDYAYDLFHHNRVSLDEFMGLPDEVEIPEPLQRNDEDISDWLSDEYGFCHEGFQLDTDKLAA